MIIHGDCLVELKKLPDNSVDLVCTDPPYGYSFMGKNWDKAVPSVEIWKECLRVLKPGGFAFVMSAPRQDVLSQMIVRIGEAGFDTDFTSIYWTYASGFPKAANIGKMVDKREGVERKVIGVSKTATGKSHTNTETPTYTARKYSGKGTIDGHIAITAPATSAAKALDGSYGGFQPKPAVEVIIVAMKPLSEKTFVDQALKNGHGVSWLDDCRIPTAENLNGGAYSEGDSEWKWEGGKHQRKPGQFEQPQGRFPANLIVSDDVLNDGRVIKSTGPLNSITEGERYTGFNHKGTLYKSGAHPNDSGSYSRYFSLDAWAKTLPFLIVPKASKREKNEGLEGHKEREVIHQGVAGLNGKPRSDGSTAPRKNSALRANFHPTVKPLTLMSYLITLGSREGDTVLEPFMGSGTTCVAAKHLNRNYIGIEREAEYVEIARARLDQQEQLKLVV